MPLCHECNGSCCTQFLYSVTHKDILRIAETIKLPPVNFSTAHPEKYEDHPAFLLNNLYHTLTINSTPNTNTCIFAIKLNDIYRCGIHSCRPYVCRCYPFGLNKEKLEYLKPFVCPKKWSAEGKEKKQYKKDIKQILKEGKEYQKITEIWNNEFYSVKSSFMDFLEFLKEFDEKTKK
ncbi:MAG: YkgJ family cysteine cluster protein [Candidatus Diapherotrites archaeon]